MNPISESIAHKEHMLEPGIKRDENIESNWKSDSILEVSEQLAFPKG